MCIRDRTYGKIADNGLEKLAGIDVILVIGAGQLGNLHDAVHIGLGNLVGQAGGKMEILAKLIDRGDCLLYTSRKGYLLPGKAGVESGQ